MRSDLDRLMRERQLAGIVVFAYDRYSPALYYATGQKLQYAIYFRTPTGSAHLLHDPMERDQAEAVGCSHSSFTQSGLPAILEEEAHPGRAFGRIIADTCTSLGIEGPIALFGDLPAGFAHALIQRACERAPKLSIDTTNPDILTLARATKDAAEIRSIRHAARGAVAAIERVEEYLASLRIEGAHLHHDGSGPVTLGTIRQLIRREFLAHDLAEPGDSIVSQGRDAGVPHNRGNDHEALHPGVPLLIDIFPCEAGGGYHSDLTRTLCVGPAPEDLKRLYGDVHDAHRLAMSQLVLGGRCREIQEYVCGLFEQRGHPTQRSHQGTEEGYVHGLGHGVGLSVHESPRLGGPPSNTQVLEPGMVITIEPGLYYPSRGLGVRIEDLVLVHPNGTFENLTPAGYELEVHPRG